MGSPRTPAKFCLALLLWSLPSPVACVTRQLPEATIETATKIFVQKGLQDIQKAAVDEAEKQKTKMQGPLPLAQKELAEIVDSSLAQAQQQVDGEKEAQAAKVTSMSKEIEDARGKVLPEASMTAADFAQSRARMDITKALEPYMQKTIQEEAVTEEERREASTSIQAALATADEMQELSHEAHDLADYLNRAHAGAYAQAADQRNDNAEGQARQSLRIARKAGSMMHDAAGLAYAALARAKEAEKQAQQAVEIARHNTVSLQKLKLAAMARLDRVKRKEALVQRPTPRSVRGAHQSR